ncbi:DUF983 domain-containing protein [Pseudofulvibacter geojedonensis]|uniref:DUF983 domain-containing protein n=1 Tax=Pseudofulvibacter geojedonensis TaxID=1123758 RepID=A0ABW3I5C9_9FLAO
MKSLKTLFKLKCPKCTKGDVFENHKIFRYSKMHTYCPNCNYNNMIEPGFFYGAMYVSYILMVAESMATFLICQVFFDQNFDLRIFPFVVGILLILSPYNYKLSRAIWIFMFYKKKLPNKN